jgi:hypothetical protein
VVALTSVGAGAVVHVPSIGAVIVDVDVEGGALSTVGLGIGPATTSWSPVGLSTVR